METCCPQNEQVVDFLLWALNYVRKEGIVLIMLNKALLFITHLEKLCCSLCIREERLIHHASDKESLLLTVHDRRQVFCSPCITEGRTSAHHASLKEGLLLTVCQRREVFCSLCVREGRSSAHHVSKKEGVLFSAHQKGAVFS